jgi:DNA-directed RNA polymerase specialized sigma24 family protein
LTERRDIGSRLENWARLFQQHRGAGQQQGRRAFDHADAQLLEQAMPALPTLQRSLLWWCYVKQETPDQVGRRLGIAMRPSVQFVDAFRAAQASVQTLVEAVTLPQER